MPTPIKCLILLLFTCLIHQMAHAQPQNENWIIPPYIVNFSSGISISPLPVTVTNYTRCNGAFDQNNNLLFFVIDHIVYDNQGNAVPGLSLNLTSIGKEINIVKAPESCDKYYIFHQSIPNQGASKLYYSMLSMSSGIPQAVPGKTNIQYGTGGFQAASVAITQNTNGKERFLYVGGGTKIDKFKIDKNNVVFEQNIFSNNASINIGGFEFEMDLSHDGKKLSIPDRYTNDLYVITLNGSGNYQSHIAYSFPGGSVNIYGAEFNPQGDKLFATASSNNPGPQDGIFEIDLTTTNAPQLIPATSNYGQSDIELGYDGLLYVAAPGNDLASLDPSSLILTPNVLISSLFDINPTLPDQVDGQDYSILVGEADLMVADDNNDLGNEPNNTSVNIWEGAVWNSYSSNGLVNQAPKFKPFNQTNYMRVWVKNVGCKTSLPAEMHLYWTIARTDELWDSHWLLSAQNVIPTGSNNSAGEEITSASILNIPPIAPNQTIPVPLTKSWSVPNPTQYLLPGDPMICFLARIVSIEDPMYNEQFGPIAPNVLNNNNIATHNTKLIKLGNDDEIKYTAIAINNPYRESATIDFFLNESILPEQASFTDIGYVQIRLDSALLEKIQRQEISLEGLSPTEDPSIFQSTAKARKISIKGIDLKAGKNNYVGINYQIKADTQIKETAEYRYSVSRTIHNQDTPGTKVIFDIEVAPRRSNRIVLFLLLATLLTIGSWIFFKKVKNQ